VRRFNGAVKFYGGIKRGNREIFTISKDGVKKKYMVPLSEHILVQDNDCKSRLPHLQMVQLQFHDILNIQGPVVQEYGKMKFKKCIDYKVKINDTILK
jgi:DNA-directed RNA polymerase subunit beta'